MNIASFRHFFERSPELLATITPDWRLRETNSAWRTLLGWSVAEISGHPLKSILRGTGDADLECALAADQPLETLIAHANGNCLSCSIFLTRVEGEICCALRIEGTADYPAPHLLASSIPHLVWLVARDGVPQYVDQHWRDYTGWRLQPPETRSWLSAVHPADRAAANERWSHATAHGTPFQAQCRLRSSSGEYRWFLAHALPLQPPRGEVHHWLGTCTDIHDLRQAQEAQEAQSRRLAEILESVTDAFFAVDRAWCCTYMNHHAERILRVRREDLLGRRVWDVVHQLGGAFEHHCQQAMQHRTLTEFEEFVETLHSWVEVRAYPTPDGLAVYFRDSTEKRRLEEKLRESTQLESIAILAGGIAHDFNNLLTGIIGSASLAQSMLLEGEPVDSLLEGIIASGERAATLTRQMLEYSGRGPLAMGKVDLSALVTGAQPILPTVTGGIETRVTLAPKLPLVDGDAAQIRQVLFSLLLNAAEAIGDTPGGRIEIRTFLRPLDGSWLRQHVLHGSLTPGPHVCLQVSDNGCGVERQILGRIFDPFFTTKFTGRGLGLAASAGIVRSHHGAMLVESSPETGTVFEVYFAAAGTA